MQLRCSLTTFVLFAAIGQRVSNRFKRQLSAEEYIDECSPQRTRQKCVVFYNSCYFVIMCANTEDIQGREAAMCTQKDHIYDDVRCCIPCCLDKVSENNPSPYCYDPTLTKEKICPQYDFAGEHTTPASLSKLGGNHGHRK